MEQHSERYVRWLSEIDEHELASTGGKAVNLGALSRLSDVEVPSGFCVTTSAYHRAIDRDEALRDLLNEFDSSIATDPEQGRAIARAAGRAITDITLPEDIESSIIAAVHELGADGPLAVRSSATAEDLPTASFAGQQDSYLDVRGADAVLHHVRRCWASLYTERALVYRRRLGLDEQSLAMAVIVQHLLRPQSAGVMFTADPLTGHRRHARIEAVRGLGDALVSGNANADVFTVEGDQIIDATIADPAAPTLTSNQAIRLVALGRRIESQFGSPQDIEWCLVDDGFQIVQSRPITTLFPVPPRSDDQRHIYVSVGHQQMMTDAMTPLGYSVFQLTAGPPMFEAGGRLFVDVAPGLESPATRSAILDALGHSDPLIGDALATVIERGDSEPHGPVLPPTSTRDSAPLLDANPAVVAHLIARTEESIDAAQRSLRGQSGADLFDAIVADIQILKSLIFDPMSRQVIDSGIAAARWLNQHVEEWLGETNVADVLSQSAVGSVTGQMGLDLLDLADVLRSDPTVVALLENSDNDRLVYGLRNLAGGSPVRAAVDEWLATYGMRGIGEIDITRDRWSDRPDTLVPLLLANIRHFEPGESARRVERGSLAAEAKCAEVLGETRLLPDGEARAVEAAAMIDRLRTFAPFREFPKHGMMRRYALYKRALRLEAERLVDVGVLSQPDDASFLTFQEFRSAVHSEYVTPGLVAERRRRHRANTLLEPPRVMTSNGEILTGHYRRVDVPDGALIGLAVSGGTVEGRARVVHNLGDAELAPGDILVTQFTDPSWTPVFLTVAALVTEVGGLMTHGSVIAREYGLPAVVGVQQATRLITDGQRIRVHGTGGFVELIS